MNYRHKYTGEILTRVFNINLYYCSDTGHTYTSADPIVPITYHITLYERTIERFMWFYENDSLYTAITFDIYAGRLSFPVFVVALVYLAIFLVFFPEDTFNTCERDYPDPNVCAYYMHENGQEIYLWPPSIAFHANNFEPINPKYLKPEWLEYYNTHKTGVCIAGAEPYKLCYDKFLSIIIDYIFSFF